MIKLGSAALVALVALIASDQYFYFGFHTDGALALLRQVPHSFQFKKKGKSPPALAPAGSL